MFDELTSDLLDLTARELGRRRPRLAMNLAICTCTCCACVAFC
ncbi:MAG TPA: hypothetical protein VFI37_00020 [Gaiellaceae bacterium]|jgi:hypothetical protein|nr:hypothetical protein [Gaiellaceae bacterium]